jgi:hypothetical protein
MYMRLCKSCQGACFLPVYSWVSLTCIWLTWLLHISTGIARNCQRTKEEKPLHICFKYCTASSIPSSIKLHFQCCVKGLQDLASLFRSSSIFSNSEISQANHHSHAAHDGSNLQTWLEAICLEVPFQPSCCNISIKPICSMAWAVVDKQNWLRQSDLSLLPVLASKSWSEMQQ